MARPTKFRHSLDDLASPALAAQVAGYVSEIELFRKQVEEIQKQIAEVYDDLDEEGFDKAIVRKLVAKRAKGSKADDEAEAIDAYEAAVEKGLSSRARVENPIPTYPERHKRPAKIAAPGKSTAAQSEGAAGSNPEQEAPARAAGDGEESCPAQGAAFAMPSGAGEGLAGPVEPALAADAKPRFTLPTPKPLRPHCLKPERCGGYGSTHCGACLRAAKADRHPALDEELA